jgi:hypothetical protein
MERDDPFVVWLLAAILGAVLGSVCFGGEVNIAGPDKVSADEGYFYALEGVSEEVIAESQWACVPLSLKAEFELCLVYDPLSKERHPAIYFKAREEGKHTLIFDVNVPGKYGWAIKEVVVGEGEPDDGDDDDDDDGTPDPLKGWSLWTKKTAERVIPKSGARREQARTLAASLEATVSASAGGAFKNAREFRVAIRSSNRAAIGEDAWALWNSKFDSLLSQELAALVKQGKFNPNDQATLRNLYLEVAKGLREVK